MHENIGRKGHGPKPFPDARQSGALSEEDAFMHTHGGCGSRAIYAIVMRVEAGFNAAWRIPAAIMKRAGHIRANGIGKGNSPSAVETARLIHHK
jgi:hypothetical protein